MCAAEKIGISTTLWIRCHQMHENNIKSVIKELDLLNPNTWIYALSDKTVYLWHISMGLS